MSEPAYTDYHQIRGTSLVIYKRKNSGAFQVRMNIEGVKGYIVKSSKKKSLDEAIETAEVMYEDYRYRVRHNLDIGTFNFSSLYKRWWRDHENTLSVHRQRFIEGTARRYLLPFFGKKPTDAITDEFVAQYSVSKTLDLEPTKSAQKSRWKLRFVAIGFRGVLEPILFPIGNTVFSSVFVFPSRNTV